MSGIAGIALGGKRIEVNQMLDQIAYRGPAGRAVIETPNATIGVVATYVQSETIQDLIKKGIARDEAGDGHQAVAQTTTMGLQLQRDPLGIAPLYYGYNEDGALCFASEVKALIQATRDINEFPPGYRMDGKHEKPYYLFDNYEALSDDPEAVARELRKRLENAVEKRILTNNLGDYSIGAWLSGGLDSSTLAALARPLVDRLTTFAAGVPGAPDLENARMVSQFIQSDHHEVVVNLKDMLEALPDVIYHLESFDAWLVRSSVTNYLVAQRASDYVPAVFSGEGGDELFAGYSYLKQLEPMQLHNELIDITGRLHNTALQRVDRCASAHGTVAHVGFLDPQVVDYALRIPVSYKLHDGVEKWILRQAVTDLLPEQVLMRPKAKFWEGAGVESQIAQYANDTITDRDFERGRCLGKSLRINSKEELYYYRIFHEHFGELEDFTWMGRTKGTPIQ